jgi:MFS family permease
MNTLEIRTAISVAAIFFCRMMGLFMVLPVISLYGTSLDGATLSLLGVAVGVYGLSQALLQIPLSMLSDLYGRKTVMLFGLAVFTVGSVCAIFADDIWMLIACRALQGAGAIAGTSMALLTDISSQQSRAKMMAFVGISIGASFVLALIIGPLLAADFGLRGIFIFSSILAFAALLVCFFGVENAELSKDLGGIKFEKLLTVLQNQKILSFAFGVFFLHLVMTASFIAIPLVLELDHAIKREMHWQIYLGVFMVALLLMAPFARPSTDVSKLSRIYTLSTVLMILALALLAIFYKQYLIFLVLMCIYFTCFNLLEALLPSLLSHYVDERGRATAMGLYSTFQFSGAFVGGVLAGVLMDFASVLYLLIACALFISIGLMLVFLAKNDKSQSSNSIKSY